uniref:ATP-dependent RecD2 DNA helicase n=1 Tax=Chlorobium chlorochromatii (strain CaD3) TaxID=340177 RepID=Q3ASB3_CHLCH
MSVQDGQESYYYSPKERLSGAVERVTFHSQKNGFSVLRIKVKGRRDLVTVVGATPSIAPGEFVECLGEWHNDSTYGLQFRATELTVVPPETIDGIEKYLASGMVKGIGPHFAKTLVYAFREDVFTVIEEEPERLLELPGIGQKRMEMVTSAWADQKVIRDIMVFLQSHGLGTSRAVRIFKTYGNESILRVKENPYRLVLDIYGVGFKTADALAMQLGIAPDSLIRAQAGVHHVLQEIASSGHCAAPREQLVAEASRLLSIPEERTHEAIDAELRAGNLVREELRGVETLYLLSLHRAELGVATSLMRLLEGEIPWRHLAIEEALPWVEAQNNITLSPSQKEALHTALTNKVTVITGGPGVGKTTLVKSILLILQAQKVRVALCAPTGRAAKRLSESTGLEAKTIHRLLEFDPLTGGFKHQRDNPLECDLVVVDESSMVDVVLMNRLLAAVPEKAALLLIGDVDQLPSVGAGAVLADIIRSETIPTIRLTEIFRQAASSRIIMNAHRINKGELPLRDESNTLSDFYLIAANTPEEIYNRLLTVITERIPARFGLHPVRDVQVLTPMNRGGLGARALNVELQKVLNGQVEPSVTRFGTRYAAGDKVIQMVNNYDKEVFNGDIGHISAVEREDGAVLVDFDGTLVSYEFGELDELSLAYATSIHKSQGSEYPAVVIPLAMQHYNLLERNLIYTAVTRGKKLVVIIGETRALAMAVKNHKAMRRLTGLAERLSALARYEANL